MVNHRQTEPEYEFQVSVVCRLEYCAKKIRMSSLYILRDPGAESHVGTQRSFLALLLYHNEVALESKEQFQMFKKSVRPLCLVSESGEKV